MSHIVQNEFQQIGDSKASLNFAKETADILQKNLFIRDDIDILQDCYDNGYVITSFSLPVYDLEFTLHNGFWRIESNLHYCQIVMHEGEYFWLRRKIFDIVRALGKNEAWHANEYYTWNGGGCENVRTPFEKWLKSVRANHNKNIKDFDQNKIMAQNEDFDCEPIYHDTFKECFETFNDIQTQIPDYHLLGIYRTGSKFLRCEKNNGLFLLREDTFTPLFDNPINGVLKGLNGPEFIVKKNGRSAVFDSEGIQLTDYVKGSFQWEWAPLNNYGFDFVNVRLKRIIYNKKAGLWLEPR